ncbi:hypothetical protein HPB51_006475 [Rhipicephalus microplus]|uniref:Translation initiation inhibitor n=1 Tax=Rhipicephalus microplus TaxID=6941 RepID=A0A9J6E624_RHIMP|nr:hypothetical protein HPB51_006475 [Rhipicephalus microplus]
MSKATREVITSEHAPKAFGPYSQAIRVGDTMYVSGQIGADPNTSKLVPGGIAAETRQALTNLTKVLEAGRMSLKCVAKCTVYLGDMNDFPEMNKVYSESEFEGHKTHKPVFSVDSFIEEACVEIEAIAVDAEPSIPGRSVAKLSEIGMGETKANLVILFASLTTQKRELKSGYPGENRRVHVARKIQSPFMKGDQWTVVQRQQSLSGAKLFLV